MDTVQKLPVRAHYDEIDSKPRLMRKRNWIPFALRLPFLASVVIFLLVCVICLEYLVIQSVPLASHSTQQNVVKRQDAASPNREANLTSIYIPVGTMTNRNSYLRLDGDKVESSTPVAPTTKPENLVAPTAPAVPTAPTIPPVDPVTPATTPIVSQVPNPNAYLRLTPSNGPTVTGLPASGSITTNSNANQQQSASTSPSNDQVRPSQTNANDYLRLSPTTASEGATLEHLSNQPTANGKKDATLQAQRVVSSMTTVITSNGKVLTTVQVTTRLVTPDRTTGVTNPTETSITQAISDFRRPSLRLKGMFSRAWYFAALYLPSIVAVILKELWAVVSHDLKMMEPFYKLGHADGALAKDTLMADYLGTTTSKYSLQSAMHGDMLMAAIFLVNIIMSVLAPIASESMTVIAITTELNSDGSETPIWPAWVLSQPLVRLLQATLIFTALIVVVLAIVCQRRCTGLAANPSKIATMASLLNHPSVIQDIHDIHPNASDKIVAQSLENSRYMLTHYGDQHGDTHYGLVVVGETIPQGVNRVPLDDLAAPMAGVLPGTTEDGHHHIGRTTSQKCLDFVFFALGISLLGTMIAYWKDASDSGFNRFFSSGQFGPKFILSFGASIITMSFQNFEREVRLATPYRQLAARQAPAHSTILRSVNGTGASNLLRSLRYGSWYHVLVAVTALLGDVLIIVVVGVPFSQNQTERAFHISISTSVIITVALVLVSITTFRWRHNNNKAKIPQQPGNSLIRVWMSLSNQRNQLRVLVSDMGQADEQTMRARIRQDGGAYTAGWLSDEHDRSMWCVDKELDQYLGSVPQDTR